MIFLPGQIVRVNTNIGFDDEGIPIEVASGAKGLVSKDQDEGSDFVQLIMTATSMETCKLGIQKRFLEHIQEVLP